jgi:hypothetical protein
MAERNFGHSYVYSILVFFHFKMQKEIGVLLPEFILRVRYRDSKGAFPANSFQT